MKSKYKSENELVNHYEAHPQYYSPVKNITYFNDCMRGFNIELREIKNILDIGCGDGTISKFIPENVLYTGVDYSPTRIKIANQSSKNNNHKFIYDCAREYVINDTCGSYDLITAFEFLEHIVNPKELIDMLLSKYKSTVVGTVPVNMPYKAHLSVWEDVDQLKQDLNPDHVYKSGNHFRCCWKYK